MRMLKIFWGIVKFVVIAVIGLILLGVIMFFIQGSDLQKDTFALFDSFKVGNSIDQFSIPRSKMVSLSFRKGETSFSLDIQSFPGNETCRIKYSSDVLLVDKTLPVEWPISEIAKFVHNKPEIFSRFDTIHVTIIKIGFPPRRSFTVYYSQDGKVTSLKEPYSWD